MKIENQRHIHYTQTKQQEIDNNDMKKFKEIIKLQT